PEPFLEALDAAGAALRREMKAADRLRAAAEFGIAHRRVPRVNGAGRAPTGRARCRHCRELIEKDSWRIGLVFFEEYRFEPSGYIHAACAGPYLETVDILDRVRHFSGDLTDADLKALKKAMRGAG